MKPNIPSLASRLVLSEEAAAELEGEINAGRLAAKGTQRAAIREAMSPEALEKFTLGANENLASGQQKLVNYIPRDELNEITKTRDLLEKPFGFGWPNLGRWGQRLARKMGNELYTPREDINAYSVVKSPLEPGEPPVWKEGKETFNPYTLQTETTPGSWEGGTEPTHTFVKSAEAGPMDSPYNAPEFKGYGGNPTLANKMGEGLGYAIPIVTGGGLFIKNRMDAANETLKEKLLTDHNEKTTDDINKALSLSGIHHDNGKYTMAVVQKPDPKKGIKGNMDTHYGKETNPIANAYHSWVYDTANGGRDAENNQSIVKKLTEQALELQAKNDDSGAKRIYRHMKTAFVNGGDGKSRSPGNNKVFLIPGVFNKANVKGGIEMKGNRIALYADEKSGVYRLINIDHDTPLPDSTNSQP
jgi:hypothetical protein